MEIAASSQQGVVGQKKGFGELGDRLLPSGKAQQTWDPPTQYQHMMYPNI